MKLLGTVIVMMLSPACGCATEGGEELADETSESGESSVGLDRADGDALRSDVTVCVNHETGVCTVDVQGIRPCTTEEWDACTAAWQPRVCIDEQTGECSVIPEGDVCPNGSLSACA